MKYSIKTVGNVCCSTSLVWLSCNNTTLQQNKVESLTDENTLAPWCVHVVVFETPNHCSYEREAGLWVHVVSILVVTVRGSCLELRLHCRGPRIIQQTYQAGLAQACPNENKLRAFGILNLYTPWSATNNPFLQINFIIIIIIPQKRYWEWLVEGNHISRHIIRTGIRTLIQVEWGESFKRSYTDKKTIMRDKS